MPAFQKMNKYFALILTLTVASICFTPKVYSKSSKINNKLGLAEKLNEDCFSKPSNKSFGKSLLKVPVQLAKFTVTTFVDGTVSLGFYMLQSWALKAATTAIISAGIVFLGQKSIERVASRS